MRPSFILVSLFALLGVNSGRAADELPKRPNFDRYSAMLKQSPFAVATAQAAPAATPNFAKDLYVANAAKSPDGDMVTIASSADKNFKLYLTTKEPVQGYSIASIEWSEKVGETKVTISKDGQFGALTFNQALLATAPNPGQVPAAPPAGVPTVPGNVPRPAAVPNLPTPPPHVRGVIPRNPNNPNNPNTAAPTPNPNVVPSQDS